jgi:hypothetical protein
VIAAGATVAATGTTAPSHVALRPAAAYQAPLITIPVTATGASAVSGRAAVYYHDGKDGTAQVAGTITGAAKGDLVQVYAQPFPFTGKPAIVGSDSLMPAGGTAKYHFTVTPSIATRYQVKVLSRTSPNPLATSPVKTIYVQGVWEGTVGDSCSDTTCKVKTSYVVHVPASALQSQMSKHIYTYFAVTYSSRYPAVLRLGAGNPVVAVPQKTGPDVFRVSVTFTYPSGDAGAPSRFASTVCTKDSEPANGVGFPGAHGCGGVTTAGPSAYLG